MEKRAGSLLDTVSRAAGAVGMRKAGQWRKGQLRRIRVGLFALAAGSFLVAFSTQAHALPAPCKGKPAGFICRPAASPCDVPEVCDGKSGRCPADGFVQDGTACDDGNACTISEACHAGICTGGSALNCDDSNACTADSCDSQSGCVHTLGNAGAVCRAAVGACDVAETCSGTSASCPADSLVATGTLCRPVAGVCDVAEKCTGTSPQCPADSFVAAGTVCRLAQPGNACDATESCTGSSAACPPDALKPATIVGDPRNGNTIVGTPGDDVIDATHGTFTVKPGDGNDCVVTDGGNDRVEASAGNDTIIDTGGSNTLAGGDGNDLIIFDSSNGARSKVSGNKGNDVIIDTCETPGNCGVSLLLGGENDDCLIGTGNDDCDGGKGKDCCLNCASTSNCEGRSELDPVCVKLACSRVEPY